MKFPDTERAHHLKAKLTKKSLNPFEAVAKRKHLDKDKISESSRQADPKVIWKPILPTYTPPLEDRGASMAVKGKSMEPALPQAVMQCLSYTANTSLNGFSCPYRKKQMLSLPRLTLPQQKVARRQIVCSVRSIPNFFFPPRARVLLNIVTTRRTFRRSGRYVCIMLHTRVVRCLTVCTEAESLCVSTASTGAGEGWRKTSSVCFAVLWTRDSVQAPGALRYYLALFLKIFLEIS